MITSGSWETLIQSVGEAVESVGESLNYLYSRETAAALMKDCSPEGKSCP